MSGTAGDAATRMTTSHMRLHTVVKTLPIIRIIRRSHDYRSNLLPITGLRRDGDSEGLASGTA